MSLVTNYSFSYLKYLRYFTTGTTSYSIAGCLMYCPSTNSSGVIQKVSHAIGGIHKAKLCEVFQGMARPINVKTIHQASILHTESSLDRLGLLSLTCGYRSQQQSGQDTVQSVLINKQAQVSLDHTSCRNKETSKTEVHGGGDLELVKLAREPASSRSKLCASLENAPRILPVRRSLLALVGRKQSVARDQLSPQKPPGSRLPVILAHKDSALPDPWFVDDEAALRPHRIWRLLTQQCMQQHTFARAAAL